MSMETIREKIHTIKEMTDREYKFTFTPEEYILESEQFLLIKTAKLLYIENILNEIISLVY